MYLTIGLYYDKVYQNAAGVTLAKHHIPMEGAPFDLPLLHLNWNQVDQLLTDLSAMKQERERELEDTLDMEETR